MWLVTRWLLRIQLNGEWEECLFATRKDALATLVALLEDYATEMRGAVLLCEYPGSFALNITPEISGQPTEYVN